jgi:hypothetical protein
MEFIFCSVFDRPFLETYICTSKLSCILCIKKNYPHRLVSCNASLAEEAELDCAQNLLGEWEYYLAIFVYVCSYVFYCFFLN